MPTPVLYQHTSAVLAALRVGTGRPIGDGRKPDGAAFPYGVLYRMTDRRDGDLDVDTDADLTYQVSCFAPDRIGAEYLAGECERVLTETAIDVPGRQVMRAGLLVGGSQPPDESTGTTLHDAWIRVRIWTTPTT